VQVVFAYPLTRINPVVQNYRQLKIPKTIFCSLSELQTQLDIAVHIGYIDKNAFDSFENQCCKVGAMMTNLEKAQRAAMRQSI
jgi:four helix bundle protein